MSASPFSRSRFLAATGALAASAALPRVTSAQTPAEIPLAVTIAPSLQGTAVPPDFLGLSFPSTTFAEQTFFNADNPSVVALIRRLAAHGVLRIGGNEVDRVAYAPARGSAGATAPNVAAAGAAAIAIAPSDLTRLAAFAERTGWSVLYGINLAGGNANDASREAAAAYNALLGRLRAFELGDNADTYTARGLRPAAYGYPQYVTDFRASADAIGLRVPSAHFAGPDVSSPDWIARFARDQRGVLLAAHWYAAASSADPNATTAHLLAPDPAYAAFLGSLRTTASENGETFRITELNAIGAGGKPGVSDTFAAALWTLDALFAAAAGGASGVNVHAAPAGPSAVIVSDAGGTHEIRPLYYALLFFSLAAPQRIVALSPTPPSSNLRAYALPGDGRTAVVLINADGAQDARVTLDAGRALAGVDVVRMHAPSLDSRTGVTLAGTSVSTDGSFTAGPPERVAPAGTSVAVRVPFASAALITLT